MARRKCASRDLLEATGRANSRALARLRVRRTGFALAAIGARAFAFGCSAGALAERWHRFLDDSALCRDSLAEAHKDSFDFVPRKKFRRNGLYTGCGKTVRLRAQRIRSESRSGFARRHRGVRLLLRGTQFGRRGIAGLVSLEDEQEGGNRRTQRRRRGRTVRRLFDVSREPACAADAAPAEVVAACRARSRPPLASVRRQDQPR